MGEAQLRERQMVSNPDKKTEATAAQKRKCGLVMPISTIDGLAPSHWSDVKEIISEALPEWSVSLVSDGEDAGVIQRRIVERLYTDEMVVVDVSARNPNVMFELGMRIAFDKPTVIVKDEITPIPFDVGPNEYIDYPRDLRFAKIVAFKKRLADKVAATAKPEHVSYLKSFGSFKVAKVDTTEVSADRLILERMDRLESLIARAVSKPKQNREKTPFTLTETVDVLSLVGVPNDKLMLALDDAMISLDRAMTLEQIRGWAVQNGYRPRSETEV